MQFENTETFKNLARSFAGECQAGMRYQMIAKLAMQEKLKTLSDAVRTIAKNETLHATQFFNKIIEKTGSRDNVEFDAGYPFHAGTLVEGLKFSATDEKNEAEDIYPTFAEIAQKEGFEDMIEAYGLDKPRSRFVQENENNMDKKIPEKTVSSDLLGKLNSFAEKITGEGDKNILTRPDFHRTL